MKKLILLFFASLSLLSCSNDDANNYYYEILPVESYEVPISFNFGETYTIALFYKKPNDCHLNQSLYFERIDSTRIIAIQSSVIDRNNCQPLPDAEPIRGTFQFEVLKKRPYIFRFYKGKDENGENIFEDVIIPVIN